MSESSVKNIPVKNSLTGEVFLNIKRAAKSVNMEFATLAKQLKTSNGYCLFEYLNNPVPRKEVSVYKDIRTDEIFLNINDVCKKEDIGISAAIARTIRRSKNWFYIKIKINYIDYLMNEKEK